MDYFAAMKISGSGLAAQRTRVDVATSNLANAESTRGPDGGPYKRRDPILEAVPFSELVDGASATLETRDEASAPEGVRVSGIEVDQTEGRRVYKPGHPDADEAGFVTMPNVDPVHEVVNLVSASRSYDANATALETLKTMAQRALDIAR